VKRVAAWATPSGGTMIVAVGVDIADVEAFPEAIGRWVGRFVERPSPGGDRVLPKHRDEAIASRTLRGQGGLRQVHVINQRDPVERDRMVNDLSGKKKKETPDRGIGKDTGQAGGAEGPPGPPQRLTRAIRVAFVVFGPEGPPGNRQRGIDFETDYDIREQTVESGAGSGPHSAAVHRGVIGELGPERRASTKGMAKARWADNVPVVSLLTLVNEYPGRLPSCISMSTGFGTAISRNGLRGVLLRRSVVVMSGRKGRVILLKRRSSSDGVRRREHPGVVIEGPRNIGEDGGTSEIRGSISWRDRTENTAGRPSPT
jgi:hypothetical protein